MIPARQSTALELSIGPVLDADGVAVTDCVVGDFKIKKTTGNFAALNGSATLTHVSAGTYDLVLTTSDTDTVGLCSIAIDDTTNACAPVYLQVIEEAIYDALYAASANAFTGAAGSTKVTGVVLADTVTTLTNLPAITSNWLTAAGLATDAVNEIADGILGRDASSSTTNSTLGAIINDWEDAGRLDAILDARASQTSVDTIDTIVDSILVDTAEIGAAGAGLTVLATAANLATVAGYLDTEIAAILADTNELQTDWANGGRLDLLLDAVVADNPNTPTKNVALADLVFTMVDATDFNTPETGVTVTATISKDGGAFASCTNAVSEISGGFYKISLTQTELNADSVALKFTGSGCAQRNIAFRTQPT